MENSLKKDFGTIAITPDLSINNISSYIENLELVHNNHHKIDFLIIRNKSLGKDEYKKLAERIMQSLMGKLPCLLHFNSLDYFLEMDDLISHGHGAHFTSSLLKKLNKTHLIRYFENEKTLGSSCHNSDEINLSSDLNLDYCILGPVEDKCINGKVVTKGIGWERFSNLTQNQLIKTYAVGGLSHENFEIASKNNAHGIAGISMFSQSS